MKYIRVYEAKYQTYADYEKGNSKWGTPEELKHDVTLYIRKGIPVDWEETEKYIKSIEDQSDPKKGIKFEIKLKDGNVVHAFKKGSFRSHWELYLNKKKLKGLADNDTLYFELFDKLPALTRYLRVLRGHDFYYNYADDHRSYKAGRNSSKRLEQLYSELSSGDKKKAFKEWAKEAPKDYDRTFADFRGV